MPETYEGWRNYPTWAVNLWLNNDPGTQEMVTEILLPCESRYDAAHALEALVDEQHEDWLDGGAGAGMFGDLLGYAVAKVDWYEIIDGWFDIPWLTENEPEDLPAWLRPEDSDDD